MENYRFGKIVCSVIATKEKVVVKTNHSFTLILNGKRHQVKNGESEIVRWFDAELNYIGPSERNSTVSACG